MEQGIYPNISHSEYHAMKDIVSNSYLQRLNECPASARLPMEETPALIFGRAFHSFLLDPKESFDRDFAVCHSNDQRTKIWKEFAEQNKGKTIIGHDDYIKIGEMYGAIATHPLAAPLLMKGRSEMSVFWTDEETGLPCKCRPDRIPDGDHGVILDLKTVRNADVHAFTRACMTYGYAREAGMYISGFNAVSSAKVDSFMFIVIEKEPPYRTEVYVMEDLFVEHGQSEFHRLLRIEKECREKNLWPHWKNEAIRGLFLPYYAGIGDE